MFDLPAVVPLVSLSPPDAGSGAEAAPAPDWAGLNLTARRRLAAQLLGAAGYGPARPLRLTVAIPAGREHAAVLAAVTRDWATLGVTVAGVGRAAGASAAAPEDLVLTERTAPAAQPLFFLRPFTCAGSHGDYCNARADALIDAARGMADEDARAATLAHAETAMLADTPMIPLFVPVRWALVARGIGGWTANQGGQHPLADLDKRR